ncbi:GNAT family N-acetyltransferase [Streptomyces sp. ODS28]|uniref:GNAT family N-acetyltransferase n=1 Tax=Streptomyces sp. ODS28 TaxID=3136688 RepID=UPI0031EB11E5
MDITIRSARPEELDEIGELTAGAYASDGLLDPGDPYLDTLRDARSREGAGEMLVAVPREGGPVLGSVVFVPHGTRLAEISAPDEAEFRMLAVRSEGRGRGTGEALVRACMDRARLLGVRRLVLSTGERMRAGHRLYERLGFTRTPERDWSPVPDVRLMTYALEL